MNYLIFSFTCKPMFSTYCTQLPPTFSPPAPLLSLTYTPTSSPLSLTSSLSPSISLVSLSPPPIYKCVQCQTNCSLLSWLPPAEPSPLAEPWQLTSPLPCAISHWRSLPTIPECHHPVPFHLLCAPFSLPHHTCTMAVLSSAGTSEPYNSTMATLKSPESSTSSAASADAPELPLA